MKLNQATIDALFKQPIEGEDPVMQEINLPPEIEVPGLYEVFQNDTHICIEDEDKAIIAYNLDARLIFVQSKEDFKITRMNIIAAHNNYPALFKRWWYYRDLLDSKQGREKLTKSGLILLPGQNN